MPYKLTCPNCGGIKIRGRLRRQELYCGDCGQVWGSPFLLKPEHLISGYKLRFQIKYDGYPIDKPGHGDVIRRNMKRERIVMVRLVSEKDGVQVYECGVCHQTFTDNSDKGGDEHGFDEALSHYVNVHETAQIESDEPRAIVNSSRSDKTMRNQAEIETLKDELDELSEKALELPPEVYEQIKELHYFQLNVVDALTWVLEQENVTTEVFRSPRMLGVDELRKVIEAN